MKQLLKTAVILLLFSLVFVSCKKNNDTTPETPQNYLSYKGQVYEMSQCLFIKIDTVVNDDQDTVYYSGLIFLSPEINVEIDNGILKSMTGTGSGISIEMVSSNPPDSFIPGRYVTESSPTMVDMPGTINSSNAFFDYNGDTDQGTSLDLDNGEVSISGGQTEIEANILMADDNGNIIEGYYKGNVTTAVVEFDKSGKMKLKKSSIRIPLPK